MKPYNLKKRIKNEIKDVFIHGGRMDWAADRLLSLFSEVMEEVIGEDIKLGHPNSDRSIKIKHLLGDNVDSYNQAIQEARQRMKEVLK